MTTTTTLDANLLHCLATGGSLTACLHFCNPTPTDWYSKKQATVETATYGSVFVAANTATEQIMALRYTLRYLGVPIKSKSYMFDNNRSVVTSATLPHSTLSKRHNILAFHRVREAIAAKIMDFHWIQSEYNLSDMLSKHWDHNKILSNDSEIAHHMWLHHTDPKISNRRDIQVTKIIHPYYAQGLKPSKLSHSHNTQDFNHLHTYTQNYISLHINIHVNTKPCHIHHKRGVTEVWHIVHF